MPLVNCGEGGREKANSQTDKLRATREVAELRAEGEKERGGRGEGNVSSTYDATLLAPWLAWRLEERASLSLSLSQKHLGNV